MPAPRRSRRRTTRSPESTPRSKATSTRPTDAARFPARTRRTTDYRFIGGKGGVGKTTCAAAVALAAAASGFRTLVISTDPAPSLGDALQTRLGPTPRRVTLRRGTLDALEIDAPRALERWLSVRRRTLERIALAGTWLDQDDVSRLLRLSLPGIDELAALLEVARLARTGRYDRIVLDTAPTGHTLRMLAMPETLRGIAGVFDQMQEKHRVMVEALRGAWSAGAEDALIAEIDREGQDLRQLLNDPDRMQVSWVTLPESMAVEETVDAAAALAAQGIRLHGVLVNRLTPSPEGRCAWCTARRDLEARAVAALRRRLPGVALVGVSARPVEPRGRVALAGIGAEITSAKPLIPVRHAAGPSGGRRPAANPRSAAGVLSRMADDETRLVLFGGKGGVGKTTCAAAAALAMARTWPSRDVLLLSTDPAHSLGDVFGVRLSDAAVSVRGGSPNLRVRELDAERGFRDVRARYAGAIDALFDRAGGSSPGIVVDSGYDRRVMHRLIDLAPPGIDELAAVIGITDAIEAPGSGLIVMDTAPSGHALRLLEMPAMAQDWARALMSILLKYQPVVGIGSLGAVLLQLSQGLGRLRALLTDRRRTSFVIVTRPAALPRAETLRLAGRLRAMHVHVPLALANAVGRGTCRRCLEEAAAQQRELVRLARALAPGIRLAVAEAQLPPPHGAPALRRWQATWYPHPGTRSGAGISSKRTG